MDTFFYMYKHDPAFQKTFKESRGFCIHHFKDLLVRGDRQLSTREKEEFFSVLFHLMEENLGRLQKEVTWFCDKHDYLNKDKDWGTSRDSVPRAMQKMGGGYPADDDLKLAP